jgi:hypothetical protein
MHIAPLLPYHLSPDIERALVALAAASDVLLLGEIHGAQEVPALAAGLLPILTPLGFRSASPSDALRVKRRDLV